MVIILRSPWRELSSWSYHDHHEVCDHGDHVMITMRWVIIMLIVLSWGELSCTWGSHYFSSWGELSWWSYYDYLEVTYHVHGDHIIFRHEVSYQGDHTVWLSWGELSSSWWSCYDHPQMNYHGDYTYYDQNEISCHSDHTNYYHHEVSCHGEHKNYDHHE